MSEGSEKFPTTIIHQEDILTKLEATSGVFTQHFFPQFILFTGTKKNDDDSFVLVLSRARD